MKTIKNLTADELRKSILQLAIQGKLVKQDPNDEPASELVKRIYEEKNKLIAEGKIKKDKNQSYIFKGDDNCYYEKIGNNDPVKLEDLPFDIPDNWMWIRMKNLVSMISGTSYVKNDIIKDGLRILRGGNIQNFKLFINDDDVFLPISYLNENTLIKKNDILIVASTGSKEVIGKPGFVNNIYFNTTIGAFLRIIRPLFTNISKYLNVYFMTEHYRKIIRDSVRGTNINNLKSNIILDMYIPLPSLVEQQRIVDKINSFKPLLDKYDKVEKELSKLEKEFPEKLKKSILQYAIEGKLVKQDPNDEPASVLLERIKQEKEKLIKEGKIKRDKNESYIYQGDDKNYYENSQNTVSKADMLFDIPYNWTWMKLGNIFDVVSACRVHQSDWKSTGIPFYRAREIGKLSDYGYVNNELFISEELYEKFRKNGIPQNNDLMITAVGTLGKTYIVKEYDKFYYKDASVISLRNIFNVNITFIDYLFKSPYMEEQIKLNIAGTTVGTITIEKAKNYIIPYPPIEEQKRIISKINQFNNIIN